MAYLLDAKADVAETHEWVPIAEASTIGGLGDPAARLLDTGVSTELRLLVGTRSELTTTEQRDRERIEALVKHRDGGGDL